MGEDNEPIILKPIQSQFREARSLTRRIPPALWPVLDPVQLDFRDTRILTRRIRITVPVPSRPIFIPELPKTELSVIPPKKSPKSFTQVANVVLPHSGELKLDDETGDGNTTDEPPPKKRPAPLPIRATEAQKALIKAKAQAAGVSVSRYVLIAALGSDYVQPEPPRDPALVTELFKLNRELTRQGTNLNQIAKKVNEGSVSAAEADGMLGIIARPLLQTLADVRKALSRGEPEPAP